MAAPPARVTLNLFITVRISSALSASDSPLGAASPSCRRASANLLPSYPCARLTTGIRESIAVSV